MNLLEVVPHIVEFSLGFITMALFCVGFFINKPAEFFINILLAVLSVFVLILYGSSVRLDGYSIISIENIYILVATILSLLLLRAYENYQIQQNYELPLFLMFTMIGSFVVVGSGDLLELYLGIELYSIALYFLLAYDKTKSPQIETVSKAISVGMVSSAVMIFGVSLIYAFNDGISFSSVSVLQNDGARLGLLFVIISLMIKLGAFPFYSWVAGVYERTILPTISVYSGIGIMTFFFALFKFDNLYGFVNLFEVIASLSILIGSVGVIYQLKIKKIIAYLTILNVGFALLPVVVFGEKSYWYVMVYLIGYLFAVTGLIAVVCSIRNGNLFIGDVKKLAGIGKQYPVRICLILFFIASLVGIPPFVGFFNKFAMITELFAKDLFLIGGVALFSMIAGVVFIIKLVKIFIFDEGHLELSRINMSLQIVSGICFLFIILFVFFVDKVLSLTREVTL